MTDDERVIPESWLRRRLSVEEAEAENMHEGIPFSGLREQWLALKSKHIDGDEIWEFCSSPESWQHHAGRAGIALVRRGIAIACIVTIMN